MTVLSEARAALERGGRVVLVTPPAPRQAADVWDLAAPPAAATAGAPAVVIVCTDAGTALDWAAAAPTHLPVHAVTGLDRTVRLLKEGAVATLAGAAADLAALVERSALKLDRVATMVLAWPEILLAGPDGAALDTLLAEAAAARRIVLSWDPGALQEFLERHAHRAPVIGALPLDDTARPLPPVAAARYVLASGEGRPEAARGVCDALDPRQPADWRPGQAVPPAGCDLVICHDVPTRAELAALAARAAVVLLLTPPQLAYARAIAAPLTAVRLAGRAERAGDRAAALRQQVAARLAAGDVDAELLLLEPLFTQFDPGEVAAALLALARERDAARPAVAPAAPVGTGFVRVFVTVGKKDRAAAKDLVGALIKEAGLGRTDIGRVEVRETFSTVELAPGVVETALQRLSGMIIRGRRVQARRDRQG